MSDRIYNNPNHKHYGPVRRMHIMLMQLFSDDCITDEAWLHENDPTWDRYLSEMIESGISEIVASRSVLRRIL